MIRREKMNRRLSGIALTAGLSAVGFLSVAAPASANTATIGSALTLTSQANSCTVPCLAVQQSQVGGSTPDPLTSPANGTLTQWAMRSVDNATFALRILRPAGSNTYTGAGTAVAPTPDPGIDNRILRYSVSLPIKQGDAIGVGAVAGDSDVGVPQHTTIGVPANVMATNALGRPPDGATAFFTPAPAHELLLQATVKFCAVPDVHKLKKVAAKQALAAADCGVRVKKKLTHKRKFRGKVLKQKVPAGTTGVPGTVVPIVIGQK
jgi:hypothetical protein